MRFLFALTILSAITLFAAGCSESAETSATGTVTVVKPVNQHCPIMGGDVTEDGGTVQWNGQTIGFCCDGCSEEFTALSDEEKAEKLAAADKAHHDHEHADDADQDDEDPA